MFFFQIIDEMSLFLLSFHWRTTGNWLISIGFPTEIWHNHNVIAFGIGIPTLVFQRKIKCYWLISTGIPTELHVNIINYSFVCFYTPCNELRIHRLTRMLCEVPESEAVVVRLFFAESSCPHFFLRLQFAFFAKLRRFKNCDSSLEARFILWKVSENLVWYKTLYKNWSETSDALWVWWTYDRQWKCFSTQRSTVTIQDQSFSRFRKRRISGLRKNTCRQP